MCSVPNGFRDIAISLHSTLYRRAARHVLTRAANRIDVEGGNLANVNCTNFVI
jgi:hypothetical protein